MLIGKDFDKVEFTLFGYDLVEPNALIGDTIIFLLSIYLAYRIKKMNLQSGFFNYWYYFYLVFGIGFLSGGFGHAFFNYWGVPGRYPSWILGIASVTLIELAMIELFPKESIKKKLKYLSIIKLLVGITIQVLIILFGDLDNHFSRGMIVPTLTSVVGLVLTLGVLGFYYSRTIDKSFKYLWMSVLVQFPSAVIHKFKINIHPWFDKNDLSHILLISGCLLYFMTIRSYSHTLKSASLNEK